MNFPLSHIPERTLQPRQSGLTIVSDKGLSLSEARNLLSAAAPYVDVVKLAFGTPLVTPLLAEKIRLYQAHGVPANIHVCSTNKATLTAKFEYLQR